jgi:hypothetical protein
MDNITHHWYKSVFNKLNESFWNPSVSSKVAVYIPYTKYKIDAWHLFKSLMIILLASSAISGMVFKTYCMINPFFDFVILIIVYGIIWNGVFNIFYNHLLNRK